MTVQQRGQISKEDSLATRRVQQRQYQHRGQYSNITEYSRAKKTVPIQRTVQYTNLEYSRAKKTVPIQRTVQYTNTEYSRAKMTSQHTGQYPHSL